MTAALLSPPAPRVLPTFVPALGLRGGAALARDVCVRAAPLPARARAAAPGRAARMSQAPASGAAEPAVPAGSVRLSLLGVSGVLNARLAILGVPFLWGCFPAVGKLLYQLPWSLPPTLFNAVRLLVAALCVLPATVRALRGRGSDRGALLRAGAELGFWTFLGSTCQIIGLRHTTASKAAFLTQLQTVLVPLFALAVGLAAALTWHVWAAAALALAGVALLTLDDAAAALTLRGDGLMLLTAVASAIFVLRTRAVATRLRPAPLVAYKVTFQMIFAFAFSALSGLFSAGAAPSAAATGSSVAGIFAGATPMLVLVNLALVVWAGAFISAMSTWLHVRAGAVVPAPETAVIFSFTPLCTSVLSIFLGERFGVKGILGGALIVLSTIVSSRAPPPKGAPEAVVSPEEASAASLSSS